MKTKKRTRIVSLLLAVLMAFSATTATITASAAYKPTYGEKATEEDFALMVDDLKTIADNIAFTGDTIEAIYAFMPSLSALLNQGGNTSRASDTVYFYMDQDPDRFAELEAYGDESGKIIADSEGEDGTVIPGTFAKFFADHPITVASEEEFAAELDKAIEMLIDPNLAQTFIMIPLMGAQAQGTELANGLDEICKALGIEQEVTADTALGFSTYAPSEELIEGYLKNIVKAIFPDSVNNILNMLRNVLKDDNFALLYDGVSKVLNNLASIINVLESSLSGLGIDFTEVINTINDINTKWSNLPTTGEGELKRIDINAAIPVILEEAGAGAITSVVKIPAIDLTHVTETATNADLLKAVFDYVYNLISTNRSTLEFVITDNGSGSLLESALKIEIPAEVEAQLIELINMSNDDLANEAVIAVASLAGREIPEEPTTEEPTTEEPTTEEPTTQKPGTTEPTTSGESTTAANADKTPAKASNPKLPNTGRTADYITGVSSLVAVCSGIALAYVLIISKKKVTE